METFIYNYGGAPVGFCLGMYVFTLEGRPVGQIQGDRVYTLRGTFVGELHDDMVVNKHLRNQGGIGPGGDPGPVRPAQHPGNRPPKSATYPDVFDYLARSV